MKFLLTFCGFLLLLTSHAQESPFAKFGKISVQDLQKKQYAIDSAAEAVVLSDIGSSFIEGNSKGWFSVHSTKHTVIHILNKSAYDEATVEVHLYVDGTEEERMDDLKAVTYNLEGGKVIETKLEKANVFTEKADKNHVIKKFTLPNVKEGSIIEYQYKVSSDFWTQIDPWSFQSNLPTLWSEFTFSVPEFFSYSFISHGYQKAAIVDKKDRVESFAIQQSMSAGPTQGYRFTAGVTDHRWVMKDVPELKPEKFTSTLKNHIAKIEFQLVSQSQPLVPHNYRGSWTAITKELLDAEYFGSGIKGSNGWLEDDVKAMTAGATTDREKARKIYQYVRDHFTCTKYNGIGTDQSPKTTFKSGKGTAADINLLLTAMLRVAGLQADPVILSTTDHGYTFEYYPMLNRFNYVVTKVQDGEKSYYLDGTHSHLGFARLLPECYNGHARVVNEEATPVYLVADSVKDRKVTSLFLYNGNKSLWEGNLTQTPGYFESYNLRDRIKEEGQENFFKELQKSYGSDIHLANSHIDSLSNYDEPIGIRYDVSFAPEKEDVLYVNPMFGEGYKTNPFKAAERTYPVEMPYATDETFLLTMQVPDGYVVDELPKQVKARFDDDGKTYFEYLVQASGGTISLRSRIKIDRAFYQPDEYSDLREFFNMIVKKQAEQIVLKKKKDIAAK